MQEIGRTAQLHIFATIYCFLLGVLVKWPAVINIVTGKTPLKVNRLWIAGALLLAISLIHSVYFIRMGITLPFPAGGFGINMLTGPFNQSSNPQNILAVISGIMIINGLYKKA